MVKGNLDCLLHEDLAFLYKLNTIAEVGSRLRRRRGRPPAGLVCVTELSFTPPLPGSRLAKHRSSQNPGPSTRERGTGMGMGMGMKMGIELEMEMGLEMRLRCVLACTCTGIAEPSCDRPVVP